MTIKNQKDTVFVGNAPEAEVLYMHLKRPERVVGIFCDSSDTDVFLPRLGTLEDVCAYLQDNPQIRRVYCSLSQVNVVQAASIHSVCKIRAVKFCAVSPVLNELDDTFVPMHVGRQLLLTPRPEPLSNICNRFVKRLFDLLVVMVVLLTVFPLVYLFRYVMAKRQHLGVVLVTHLCTGPNGKVFSRLCFNTCGTTVAGLDNMPQLLNVLTGKMSLVGPAPIPEADADGLQEKAASLERSYLKSGMTGWDRLKTADDRDSLKDDIWYVEHWSLWLDVCILFKTLFK